MRWRRGSIERFSSCQTTSRTMPSYTQWRVLDWLGRLYLASLTAPGMSHKDKIDWQPTMKHAIIKLWKWVMIKELVGIPIKLSKHNGRNLRKNYICLESWLRWCWPPRRTAPLYILVSAICATSITKSSLWNMWRTVMGSQDATISGVMPKDSRNNIF